MIVYLWIKFQSYLPQAIIHLAQLSPMKEVTDISLMEKILSLSLLKTGRIRMMNSFKQVFSLPHLVRIKKEVWKRKQDQILPEVRMKLSIRKEELEDRKKSKVMIYLFSKRNNRWIKIWKKYSNAIKYESFGANLLGNLKDNKHNKVQIS